MSFCFHLFRNEVTFSFLLRKHNPFVDSVTSYKRSKVIVSYSYLAEKVDILKTVNFSTLSTTTKQTDVVQYVRVPLILRKTLHLM